ncbi:MAG TPA: ABC transporter substrate-binding protein [Candidatus Binatia bacterium]
MKNSLIRKAQVISTLLSPLVMLGQIYGADAPLRVQIAYASRTNSVAPEFIAQANGFVKAEGLEVELIQMNPRLGATALANGDVWFTNAFTSTFRGILQGFPLKLVLIHQKKTPYFLMVRPEIKDGQQLKGKKLGVSTIRGSDHLVAEELMQSKGFNPAQIQAVAIGESGVRMQALVAGAIDATAVSSPHDFMLRRRGFNALAGPPELGVPGAGMFTSDRLLRENPQAIKGMLKALLRAHQQILDNKPETLRAMLKWLPQQSAEVAEHAYENELKSITRDGLMTDAEVNGLINRFGEKKRPLDEVRDFSLARQAWKEIESGR